jgi:hypothetical protein
MHSDNLTLMHCDDVRNIARVLLNALKSRLVPHLPTRVPTPPETMSFMGGGGNFSVALHPRPFFEGTTRVIVEGDLIVVEVRKGEGWAEAWRSDAAPVQAPNAA